MKKTLIRGGTLVTAKEVRKSDILVSVTGEIEEVGPGIPVPKNGEVIAVEGMLLFPLLTDCHVHFREPGLEHKATMATEARAALAGGIGTVCDMPNTLPPTTTIAALADKVRRAATVEGCIIRFFFGITETAHLQELRALWTGTMMEMKRLKQHCCGVKLYLDHSTGNQRIAGDLIEEVFRTCAELRIPLVVHCEDPEVNAAAAKKTTRTDIAAHSLLRPPESEERAMKRALELAKKHASALHIAHLSTKQGAALVRQAKRDGLQVTCEVTPHHLFLTSDDYATLGTFVKVNPSLGTREHRDALWEALTDGTIDCIASDHAPHTLEEKRNPEPLKAPSGMPGVETMLPLLLTAAAGIWPHPVSEPAPAFRRLSYSDIVRLCFVNPNRIFPLHSEALAKGAPLRLALIDPAAHWTITPAALRSKCGWTPYEAWQMTGAIVRVLQQ